MEVRALARRGGGAGAGSDEGMGRDFCVRSKRKNRDSAGTGDSSENRWLRRPGTALHSSSIAGSASPVVVGDQNRDSAEGNTSVRAVVGKSRKTDRRGEAIRPARALTLIPKKVKRENYFPFKKKIIIYIGIIMEERKTNQIVLSILETMLEQKLISEETFRGLKARADETIDIHGFFIDAVSKKEIRENVLYKAYSHYFKIPLISSVEMLNQEFTSSIIPEKFSRERELVAVGMPDNSSITVSISNPFDTDGINLLSFISDRKVNIKLGLRSDILSTIEYQFTPDNFLLGILRKAGIKIPDLELIVDSDSQAPIVKLLNITLADAIEHRASDIHIEPLEKQLIIRYRIDGELRQEMKLPTSIHLPLISRIKVLSKLDLTNRFSPQDGKIRLEMRSRHVDLRISTMPTIFGEKVVIRILDQSSLQLLPEKLGIIGDDLADFRTSISKPFGVILLTGPTGSGKSTTLYSAVNQIQISFPGVNITTIEDPVEYELPGINQVQVNPKRNVTFASTLRSILRQDPDVILIGEIRDRETALIAVQASQTGHLVLSTLHTNDSLGAVSRLKEFGIDINDINEALIAIFAQRLVKKICPYCIETVDDSEYPQDYIDSFRRIHPDAVLKKGSGCQQCDYTGFLGRTAVIEKLIFDKNIKDALRNFKENDIREIASKNGMRNLPLAGMELVARGITELATTIRVTGINESELSHEPQNDFQEEIETKTDIKSPQKDQQKAAVLFSMNSFEMKSYKFAFNESGLSLDSVSNQLELIERLHKQTPDILILDLRGDNKKALSLLDEIGSHLCFLYMPLLILTDFEIEKSVGVNFCSQADDYLVSPFDTKDVVARSNSLIARGQLQ